MQNLISYPCTWRGGEMTTYWRELTAGQRNTLLKGQSVRHEEGAKSVMTVDVQLSDSQNMQLVQMTLCDANGAPVYDRVSALHAEPAGKVRALTRLAQRARDEYEGDAEGNG